MVEADQKVAAQRGRLAQIQRRVVAATGELGQELGVLRADVDSAVAALEQKLTADLASLSLERQTTVQTLDRDGKIRLTRLSNAVVAAGSKARDAAAEAGRRSPAPASPMLSRSDLCPALSVRPFAHLGTAEFREARTVNHQTPTLPALVPFVNEGHLVIEGPSGDPQVEALLTHLVAQAFTSAPAGQMVVTVFDPKLKSTLAGFQAHGASTEAKVFVPIHPSHEALEKALAEHLGYMIAVGASTAKQYKSMGDLVAATAQHEHQYRTLVLLDAPAFWSERAANDLQRIIDRGASAGISVIIHRDPSEPTPNGCNLDKVTRGASQVRRNREGDWAVAIPGVQACPNFEPAAGPTLEAQQRLMEIVVGAAKEGVLPKVPFSELVDHAPWWLDEDGTSRSTAGGVRITLGRKGNQTVAFTLGDTVTNLHNVLVGGRAGSGKTVLLKAMIYSMAARYSPDELRLFLLDYKEGVEFQQFIAAPESGNALPHADVVSIESDAQFGLATLHHFLQELQRRSEEFKRVGNIPNIAEYRRQTGEVMPRWVLFIDEFQGALSGPGYIEVTAALEDLVRRGRSFGLHLVLASQTLSGIKFDGDKDKAIFENIPARIVLQLGPDEATKFLQPGNDGAAQLRYRGQAILNTQGGAPNDNQQFVVAFGDQEYYALQDELAEAAKHLTPHRHFLRVYRGDQYVSARALVESNERPTELYGVLPVWFGQESTVAADAARAELATTSGSNLLVLGSLDVAAAVATVQTAVLTAAVAARGLRVLLLESLLPQFRQRADIEAWIQTLRTLGAEVVTHQRGEEEAFLERIKDAANGGHRTLAVLLGPENSEFKSLANFEWEELIRELPRRNVNIVGHWSDLRDIPGDAYNLRNDYKTILFVGGDEQLIEQASGRSRYDIPPLSRARTVVFSAASSQRGFSTVASIRPLDHADHQAWAGLA